MGCCSWSAWFRLGFWKVQSKAPLLLTMIIVFTYFVYCLTGYCETMPSPLPASPQRRDTRADQPKLEGDSGRYQSAELQEPDRTQPSPQHQDQHQAAGGLSAAGWNISVFNNFGSKKFPQAVIIGVKKGGTRALLEFLRIHPDVRAVGAEPHYFDRNYERGLDWYRLSHGFLVKVVILTQDKLVQEVTQHQVTVQQFYFKSQAFGASAPSSGERESTSLSPDEGADAPKACDLK